MNVPVDRRTLDGDLTVLVDARGLVVGVQADSQTVPSPEHWVCHNEDCQPTARFDTALRQNRLPAVSQWAADHPEKPSRCEESSVERAASNGQRRTPDARRPVSLPCL